MEEKVAPRLCCELLTAERRRLQLDQRTLGLPEAELRRSLRRFRRCQLSLGSFERGGLASLGLARRRRTIGCTLAGWDEAGCGQVEVDHGSPGRQPLLADLLVNRGDLFVELLGERLVLCCSLACPLAPGRCEALQFVVGLLRFLVQLDRLLADRTRLARKDIERERVADQVADGLLLVEHRAPAPLHLSVMLLKEVVDRLLDEFEQHQRHGGDEGVRGGRGGSAVTTGEPPRGPHVDQGQVELSGLENTVRRHEVMVDV